jgi:hypothetical protein
MIKTEQISDRLIKSYSDNHKMIRPVFDRLGKPINPNALYDSAIDIIVNGQPRYDYIETDQEIVAEAEVIED